MNYVKFLGRSIVGFIKIVAAFFAVFVAFFVILGPAVIAVNYDVPKFTQLYLIHLLFVYAIVGD